MSSNGKIRPPNPQSSPERASIHPAIFAGVLFFIGSGLGYRYVSAELGNVSSVESANRRTIGALTMDLAPWAGYDIPISAAVLSIAGYDDNISRRYDDRETGESVWLFIGYTNHPQTMPRHRPTVCYPNTGFTHLETREVTLNAKALTATASVHAFVKPGIPETRTIVLNYYVLDGTILKDDNSFWGTLWKTPSLAGHASHYVAQVEISTAVGADPVRDRKRLVEFAERSLPEILRSFSKEAP